MRFAEPKILQELQHLTNFVKGQADDINEVSNLDDDLQTEFTSAQDAWDDAVLIVGAAIDFVGDDEGSSVFQAPYGPSMRKTAVRFGHAIGKTLLGAFGQLEFVGVAESATSAFA